MVTPAFSHAWISADPASIDTFFPSIVSSTSAFRLAEDANVRVAACLVREAIEGFDRAAARSS